MAEELSVFEKYARGIPISEELEALRDGRDFAAPQEVRLPPAAKDDKSQRMGGFEAERELTRGERIALKELRLSPGWPILLRIIEKSSLRLEKSAINASKGDPLGRDPRTGECWMELKMLEMALNVMPRLVAQEIEILDGEVRQ